MANDTPRLLLTAGAIPLPLCLCDLKGRVTEVNVAFAALAGLTPAEMAGQAVTGLDLLAPGTLRSAMEALERHQPLGADRAPGIGILSGREAILSAVRNQDGALSGLAILVVPSPAAELAEQEQRASFALECAGQWVWEWDLLAGTVWRSPNWQRVLGYAEAEFVDDSQPWAIVHPEDRAAAASAVDRMIAGETERFEATYRLRHRNGGWRWFMSRGRIAARGRDGHPVRVLATTIDVNRQKEIEARLTGAMAESAEISRQLAELNAQLAQLSEHDGLTGLANRRAFEQEWPRCVAEAGAQRAAVSLLMVDVDYFKQFNDLMGHVAGDDCLRRVADAMAGAAGPDALACRYGGEEFAVLLANVGCEGAEAVADRIMAAVGQLAEPHGGSPFGRLTVSIGLATLEPGETADALLRRADGALYDAKRTGRNRICIAAPAQDRPSAD
ncbi:diguanylate cyclase [Xanthobacter autotrophicus DSM 431]|uniref:sensor domain-containing diguanylate cyclase n=1 Tax=Xanthobacter nonsaccharivorans TaxID=3119912 RepID=UPI00372B3D9C